MSTRRDDDNVFPVRLIHNILCVTKHGSCHGSISPGTYMDASTASRMSRKVRKKCSHMSPVSGGAFMSTRHT